MLVRGFALVSLHRDMDGGVLSNSSMGYGKVLCDDLYNFIYFQDFWGFIYFLLGFWRYGIRFTICGC